MSIGSHGNATAFFLCELQQTHAQVLPRRVSIDLHRLIQASCLRKDFAPVALQTKAAIPHPSLRVAEDVNVRIPQRGNISLCLMFRSPKRGVEAAEDEIELCQRG